MSPSELAEFNKADRVRVLRGAVANTERGLQVRGEQCGRVDAIERNLTRLRGLLAEAEAA